MDFPIGLGDGTVMEEVHGGREKQDTSEIAGAKFRGIVQTKDNVLIRSRSDGNGECLEP